VKKIAFLLLSFLFLIIYNTGFAQSYNDYEQALVDEHIFEGFPSYDNIRIRQAYILSYNNDHRIANWVAYHVEPDYLKTVPRYSRFAQYRTDWSLHNPVLEHEYEGLTKADQLVRGHLAPFNISGGDRDGDGLYGVRDTNRDSLINKDDMIGLDMSEYVDDANEMSRVYEINYMSNVTPQDQYGFNGGSGIWRDLERFLQETIVGDQEDEIWVIAGPVLGKGSMKKVGPNKDITVPPMFFKIAVRYDSDDNPLILAFLMPHHREAHGSIQDYLVSVDIIEALTGLDFFRELDDDVERELEATDTWVNWPDF
jgi:endonuclease G